VNCTFGNQSCLFFRFHSFSKVVTRINDRKERKIISESFSNILITVSLNTTEKKVPWLCENTTDHRPGAGGSARPPPAPRPADGVAPCPLSDGQQRAGSHPATLRAPRHTHTHTVQHVKIAWKSVDRARRGRGGSQSSALMLRVKHVHAIVQVLCERLPAKRERSRCHEHLSPV